MMDARCMEFSDSDLPQTRNIETQWAGGLERGLEGRTEAKDDAPNSPSVTLPTSTQRGEADGSQQLPCETEINDPLSAANKI